MNDLEFIEHVNAVKAACKENYDEYCSECPFNKDHICIIKIPQEWDIPIPISDDEKAILRNLDDELKWIARDKNGDFFARDIKPIKSNNGWVSIGGSIYDMPFPKLFQWIKWEDDEPYYIPDLLKE